MTSARDKELFLEALETPAPERAAFLERACGGDDAMLARIAALLEAHAQADLRLGSQKPITVVQVGPVAGDFVGDYRIEELLGEGGFGRVFRAEQLQPVRRRVALKILKPGMDSRGVLARFEAERHVLARMNHPHIARVLDAGSTGDGRSFFVMELVDGVPITRAADERRLDLAARARLFRDVCLAIQHAHGKGVLHRDVKPSNVLVVELDGILQPRVIDFGIAKAIEGEGDPPRDVTAEGLLVGTPEHMSPEQAAGSSDLDTRSDVYALGVLFYELVAGRPPFVAAGPNFAALAQLARRVREEQPEPPSRVARAARGAEVPPEIDWIVLRALEKDRDRRYASAAELAADVERFLGGRPVEAAPPSRIYRLKKLVARHRALTSVAAAAVLALVLGIAGTLVGLVRARDEAARAERQARVARSLAEYLTVDVLGAVQPAGGGDPSRGRDARMLDVLDAAAKRIDSAANPGGRFADEPVVEAGVRYALGDTYGALGDDARAWPHVERAHALFARELGPDANETRRAENVMARTEIRLGRFAEGEARLRARLARRDGGTDDIDLRARLHIGRGLFEAGRRAEAVTELEVARERAARFVPKSDPISADIDMALAIALDGVGRRAEAESLLRDLVAHHVEVDGPDSPDALAARANLASLLGRSGKNAEALAELERVVADQRRVFGDDHPEAFAGLLMLGSNLRDAGRLDDALERLEDALSGAERRHGRLHDDVQRILTALAWTRERRGELDLAEQLFRDAAARSAALTGPDSEPAVLLRANVASFLLRHRRLDEARPILEETSARLDTLRGIHDLQSILALDRLAILAEHEGDFERCVEVHRAAAARWRDLPRAHKSFVGIRNGLAQALADLGRWSEGIAVLEEIVADVTAARGESDPEVAKCRHAIESWRTQTDGVPAGR